MLVDWFTVGAQALNFIVLVWLLKRFLYRPVLAAIDAREQRISSRLAEAAAREAEAAKEKDALAAAGAAFERERSSRLAALEGEVQALRARLREEVRQAAEAERVQLRAALERERRTLEIEGGSQVIEQVFAIARKVLLDLADETLETRLAAMLAQRLDALGPEVRALVAASPAVPIVRSARPLPAPLEAALAHALASLGPTLGAPRFEVESELVAGAEVILGGYRFTWSVGDYLDVIEHRAARELAAPGAVHAG